MDKLWFSYEININSPFVDYSQRRKLCFVDISPIINQQGSFTDDTGFHLPRPVHNVSQHMIIPVAGGLYSGSWDRLTFILGKYLQNGNRLF